MRKRGIKKFDFSFFYAIIVLKIKTYVRSEICIR